MAFSVTHSMTVCACVCEYVCVWHRERGGGREDGESVIELCGKTNDLK